MAPIAEVPAMDSQLATLEKSSTPKEALESSIRAADMVPLWNTGAPPSAPAPHTKHIPAVWRYADSTKLLLKAAEVVDPKEAERRAVLFINPGPKSSPHTSDVLLAAHQLILPGEQALCHRHSPFAVRFLIEGEQGYTAISGKKMYMVPGDLIITPVWNWHDHGNEGTKNVIWLDGLNIPFFKQLPVDFTEHYEEEFGSFTHESKTVSDAHCKEMKFPWANMQAKLDAPGGSYAFSEYLLPDGKSVSTMIGAFAEKIAAGAQSLPRQETPSNIFQVHRGRGWTEATNAKGETTRLDWSHGDCFVIPAWYRFVHFAEADEPAYLFSFSDKPLHVNLAIYRSNL